MKKHVFKRPMTVTQACKERDILHWRALLEWLEYGETRLDTISQRYSDEKKRRATLLRTARQRAK